MSTKRNIQRQKKVQVGIEMLDQWLQDLMRQGLATVQMQPYQFWEDIAAKMVDAQAPGLARRLRSCSSISHSGEGWPQRLLIALGKLYLLVQGYQRLSSLPAGLQADVKTQVGWTIKKEEVLATTEAQLLQCDHWQVVGVRILEEDQLWSQRVWLWGIESDRPALLLNFSYGAPTFDHQGITLIPGIVLPATLAFYPSSYPLRALIKQLSGAATSITDAHGGLSISKAIARYGDALSQNPWLERIALVLEPVMVMRTESGWFVVDSSKHGLPVHPQFPEKWELLAVGGGEAVAIAAEWNGEYLWPLSIIADQRMIVLQR